jgi:hypothetical protein
VTFIKLTNANIELLDEVLLINMEKVISVFESVDDNGQPITMLYVSPTEFWNVKESINSIYDLIDKK